MPELNALATPAQQNLASVKVEHFAHHLLHYERSLIVLISFCIIAKLYVRMGAT